LSRAAIAPDPTIDAPVAVRTDAPAWIAVVFFASGFAALVYQVVWQRALFAIFGINTEAVTVVVSVFLLGLGLGSLAGGVLSRSTSKPLLLFALSELGIASFGVISLHLFRAAGVHTVQLPAAATAVITFLLLLAPTLLMGMTLPLLVVYLVQRSGNVGRSTSLLYFVNTAGSGLAAIAAVLVLMPRFGERGSVRIAALTNLTVALIVLVQHLRRADDA
jgi:spermidine synthase